jgi:hypothetical protein
VNRSIEAQSGATLSSMTSTTLVPATALDLKSFSARLLTATAGAVGNQVGSCERSGPSAAVLDLDRSRAE